MVHPAKRQADHEKGRARHSPRPYVLTTRFRFFCLVAAFGVTFPTMRSDSAAAITRSRS